MTTRDMDEAERQAVVDTAHSLAEIARAAILPWFRKPGLDAQNKAEAGFDPVTQADRASEAAMRAHLRAYRSEDGILGEEFEAVESRSGLTWVLDPVDGTRGFLAGTPCWGVLIALADADGPFLGVIDQPYIGERFLGGLGQAWMTGPQGRRDLCTSGTLALADAVLFTTFPEIGAEDERAAFGRVAQAVRLTRYGLDCYAYALVAAGHADLVIEAGLNPYDIAAPQAVIEAAGGVVTNWQGGRVDESGQVLAAANQTLHTQALALLQGA